MNPLNKALNEPNAPETVDVIAFLSVEYALKDNDVNKVKIIVGARPGVRNLGVEWADSVLKKNSSTIINIIKPVVKQALPTIINGLKEQSATIKKPNPEDPIYSKPLTSGGGVKDKHPQYLEDMKTYENAVKGTTQVFFEVFKSYEA